MEGKVFTIPGPVLNYGGPDTSGAQFMPVLPPKNPGCLIFGVGMPHARFGGDTLTKCMFVDFLIGYIGPPYCVHY